MWVTVGNGDAPICGDECSEVKLKMGDAIFTVDLILLPIYGADLVLGVQWMRQLGPILFDYDKLWMEFTYQGNRLRLLGLNHLHYDMARPPSLRKSGADAAQFYQLTIEPIT